MIAEQLKCFFPFVGFGLIVFVWGFQIGLSTFSHILGLFFHAFPNKSLLNLEISISLAPKQTFFLTKQKNGN
jgi:hypothetical protein